MLSSPGYIPWPLLVPLSAALLLLTSSPSVGVGMEDGEGRNTIVRNLQPTTMASHYQSE